MKKEAIILSIIALSIGLLVAVIIFFIYQSTQKIKPSEVKTITINEPSPTSTSGLFLTINSPRDEEVVNKKNIKVSGKTVPNAKIVIISPNNEEAAIAAKDGSFSTDINLVNDENIIEIIAIAPNGEIVKIKKVVSFSTEDF